MERGFIMNYIIIGDKEKEVELEKLINEIKEKNIGIEEKYFDCSIGEDTLFFENISINSIFETLTLNVVKRVESIKKIDSFFEKMNKFEIENKYIIIDILDEDNKINLKLKDKLKERFKIIEIRKEKNSKNIIKYIMQELNNISESDAFLIIEMVSENIYKIKNEVEKLKRYFGEEPFEMARARKIISKTVEYDIYEVVDEFLKGNKERMIEYLKNTENHMLILYTIAKELQFIYKLTLIKEKGNISNRWNYNKFKEVDYPKIKEYFTVQRGNKDVPVHEYVLFKKLDKIDMFEVEFIEKKIKENLEREYDIKSGLMDEKTAVELYVLGF